MGKMFRLALNAMLLFILPTDNKDEGIYPKNNFENKQRINCNSIQSLCFLGQPRILLTRQRPSKERGHARIHPTTGWQYDHSSEKG